MIFERLGWKCAAGAVLALVFLGAGCGGASKSSNIADADSMKTESNNDSGDSSGYSQGSAEQIPDPLEPVNRAMFFVNDTLHYWIFKPVSQAYKDTAPEPVREGIGNFFGNLTAPVRFTNCLLQGKGDSAGTELDRFLLNTTIGVLGFGDPAEDRYGLEPVKEDLGQTLAVYGVGDGFYLVLPILGPSSLRDTAGRVGDSFLNPVHYVEPTETRIGIYTFRYINRTSLDITEYERLKSGERDAYINVRDKYFEYRRRVIGQ